MKRILAWFAGLVGIAALGRFLAGWSKSRPAPEAPAPQSFVDAVAEPADDPAVELRRRLAETRGSTEPDPDAGPSAEEGSAAGGDEPLDDRRARVHAQARETIDTMTPDGPS